MKDYRNKQPGPHMPYGGDKIIFLELHKRYFKCNIRFYEKFNFMSPFGMFTNSFEQYIQWNWGFVSGNRLNNKTIHKKYQISYPTVLIQDKLHKI